MPCCGNCTSGKPCCSTTKPKPRPAFERRRGLWLPRRDLTLPKNLLQFPSEAEWSGLWRPWQPARSVTFDLSCLPCCQQDCADCDPGVAELAASYSGALTGSSTLLRDDGACGGIGAWRYGRVDFPITTTCSPLWTVVASICVYCDNSGTIKGVFTDPRAGCNFVPNGAAIDPDSWSCDPFAATFSFVTTEESEGDCLCGAGQSITFTIG